MSMREMRAWRPMCDICHQPGPVMFDEHKPAPPDDWSRRTLQNCGLTGYTRHEIICPDCTQRLDSAENGQPEGDSA
jgi:hypothetical protein